MGLFSKRRDETPDGVPREEGSGASSMPKEDPAPAPQVTPAPVARPAAAAAPRPALAFGIEQAIALLKSMPPGAGSPKAYIGVVKKTLEAVGVSVEQIVADGERRSAEVVAEIGALQEEVQALESAAAAKKQRVADLQTELEDIGQAQERFRAETSGLGLGSPSASSSAPPGEGLGLLSRGR
jgi:hypothetical protein